MFEARVGVNSVWLLFNYYYYYYVGVCVLNFQIYQLPYHES